MSCYRNCNCDVGDNKDRVDAGVFGNQGDMPITSISFGPQENGGSGSLSLGRLYCVDKPIGINIRFIHTVYCVESCGYIKLVYLMNSSVMPVFAVCIVLKLWKLY